MRTKLITDGVLLKGASEEKEVKKGTHKHTQREPPILQRPN